MPYDKTLTPKRVNHVKGKMMQEKASQLNHLIKIRICDLGKIRSLGVPFELVDGEFELTQSFKSKL